MYSEDGSNYLGPASPKSAGNQVYTQPAPHATQATVTRAPFKQQNTLQSFESFAQHNALNTAHNRALKILKILRHESLYFVRKLFRNATKAKQFIIIINIIIIIMIMNNIKREKEEF